jgi:hypothetical protein
MKNYTLRTHSNPSINATHRLRASLLQLQTALTAAESGVPACPPRLDANEQCALQLIARMQARYKRLAPFSEWSDVPNPQGARLNLPEMAGTHAG